MTKAELIKLAERVEQKMIFAAQQAAIVASGVTGQVAAMERASHCATVSAALRAIASTMEDDRG